MNNPDDNRAAHAGELAPINRSLSALVLVLAVAGRSVAGGFFNGPPATPGDPMFFSIYSILKVQKGNLNLQKISDGGFTSAGPHYGAGNGGDPINNSTVYYSRVADAAEEGLGMIAHIAWHPGVVNDTNGNIRPNSMAAISEASVRAHVRQVMDYTLNDPLANATTSKWYLLPEELRPWMNAEMDYLSIVADEVKLHDPLGRPVSAYNPGHREVSQLNSIIGQGLDETLMGVYVTNVPFATRGARVGIGFDRIVASAHTTSTTPIMGVQLSEDFNSTEINNLRTALGGVSSAAAVKHVIRHDVYQGLLRGIEGVQIWSGHDNRPGLTTFTDQLEGYISVSRDMNVDLDLADVFLRGEVRSDFQATVLTGPSTVSYVGSPANYTVDTVTVRDIAYGDDRYLFLANSSNSPLTIRVDGLPPGVPEIDDLFANAPEMAVNTSTGQISLAMQPLEVVALRIESVSNADADDDGDVDGRDFLAWQRGLGSSGATTVAGGDFNYDGLVNNADLAVWTNQFNTGSQVAVSSVAPEPACIVLVISSTCAFFASRRLNAKQE